jgi:ElaB/YqjD/DUF883 family membrane-anchored ribosome-binding protein
VVTWIVQLASRIPSYSKLAGTGSGGPPAWQYIEEKEHQHMEDRIKSFADPIADQGSTLREKLSDTATQVKEKVTDFGRSTANKIDENRDAAAGGLEKAASAIHEKGDRVSSLAHNAADTLNNTAGYVREHDVNRMMKDVETLVRNNPGPSLLVAGAIGFLVGRAFSSSTD